MLHVSDGYTRQGWRRNLRRSQQTSCLFASPQGEALPRLGQVEIWVKSGPRWWVMRVGQETPPQLPAALCSSGGENRASSVMLQLSMAVAVQPSNSAGRKSDNEFDGNGVVVAVNGLRV